MNILQQILSDKTGESIQFSKSDFSTIWDQSLVSVFDPLKIEKDQAQLIIEQFLIGDSKLGLNFKNPDWTINITREEIQKAFKFLITSALLGKVSKQKPSVFQEINQELITSVFDLNQSKLYLKDAKIVFEVYPKGDLFNLKVDSKEIYENELGAFLKWNLTEAAFTVMVDAFREHYILSKPNGGEWQFADLTVILRNTDRSIGVYFSRLELIFDADFDSKNEVENLLERIRQAKSLLPNSETIKIVSVEKGSVRIIIEGNSDEVSQVLLRLESEESSFKVEDPNSLLVRVLDSQTSSEKKSSDVERDNAVMDLVMKLAEATGQDLPSGIQKLNDPKSDEKANKERLKNPLISATLKLLRKVESYLD